MNLKFTTATVIDTISTRRIIKFQMLKIKKIWKSLSVKDNDIIFDFLMNRKEKEKLVRNVYCC